MSKALGIFFQILWPFQKTSSLKILKLQALLLYEPLCLLLYILKFLYLQECNDQKYPSIYARLDDYNNLHFIREKAFNENIAKPDGINGMYLQIQFIE